MTTSDREVISPVDVPLEDYWFPRVVGHLTKLRKCLLRGTKRTCAHAAIADAENLCCCGVEFVAFLSCISKRSSDHAIRQPRESLIPLRR